jgi:hypothetical protein
MSRSPTAVCWATTSTLFIEKSTGEDSVIYRSGEGYRLVLARPRTHRLSPVDPSVTVCPARPPHLSMAEAIDRLEAAGQPFLFFVNAETSRSLLMPRPAAAT